MVNMLAYLEHTDLTWPTCKPDTPKDVRIHVNGSTAKISWTIPTNIQKSEWHEWSRIYINTSTGRDIDLDPGSKFNFKDIGVPKSSFEINNLKICSEYIVRIQFLRANSEFTSKTFWMTNSIFTGDINEDVSLSWTTSMTDFFYIQSPSSALIYQVSGGVFVGNNDKEKHVVNSKTIDIKAINITVLHVDEKDAGLYRAEDINKNVEGCCLLVVTGKPKNPTLNVHPEHPFVDDNLTVTCNSTVQRWPTGYGTAHLLYQFFGNSRGKPDKETLIINKLTIMDKGINISCQATDDLEKVSNTSDVVTIDPYYGPDDIILNPAYQSINLTEGSSFGPIHCSANCNPECIFKWIHKRTPTPPTKPTLTIQSEHPFVGDNITFTCKSAAQRWPGNIPAHLLYQFIGNKRGESNNNRLIMNNLTKLDKGTSISCQATDDLRKVSNMSNTVILDPYYGPENVVVEPSIRNKTVTEGTALGPIHCIANCYPECKYNWKRKMRDHFKPVTNEFIYNNSRSVYVVAIKRNQAGTYRCLVDHPEANGRTKIKDISVNVQYGPENVVVEPEIRYINVTEGTTLGPIHCIAKCNPECRYNWNQNISGNFEPVKNKFISKNNQSVHMHVQQ
ncbi:Hypothetical predicted protein [Mytilus galloprovincialis]|uniref:Ig-like domain-containing protein n=1 Tax=Mytilus galloprovincialis TaxID=29158 RepID=A0A8B6CHK1_MYTGA|nr:Hypothetical predicted protein [Mytilus galloprovincialis]